MRILSPLNIDDVVVWFVELRLREIREKAFVTAVAVDDKDFVAAITSHLVGGFL